MMMMMSLRLQLVLTLALLSIVAVVSTSSNNFDDSSSNDYGDFRNLAAGGGGGSSNSGDEDHLHDPLFNGAVEGWRLALTSLLCWMVTSCAVAAGIGGGGLLVPLYALVLGVGTKLAIPISTATIFGVAIGNVAFIATKRHPNANRPLIEYATVVLMQPGELMGVVVGVLLNRLFPELLIVILLVLVLGFTALKTLKKGIARWKSETKLQLEAAEQQQEQAVLVEDDGVVDPSETRKEAPARESTMDVENSESSDADAPEPPQEAAAAAAAAEQAQDDNENNESSSDELAQIYKEESIQFPPLVYIALFVMTSFLIIYSLLLNGVIVQDFDNCSPAAYWPAYWSPVLVFGAMVWYFSRRNIARYLQKIDLGFVFADGDIHWSTKTVSLLGPAAVGAGVAAGLLGIGGGMVLGPLFVALNFEPQVGTASTGFMILFTALSSTVQYLTVGRLPWRYALWFGAIGAIGGQTGQRVVKKIIVATGRPSIVVVLLGSIIALAVLIMATSGLVNVVSDSKDGKDIWAMNTDLFVCSD